jgi:hypothetical protein
VGQETDRHMTLHLTENKSQNRMLSTERNFPFKFARQTELSEPVRVGYYNSNDADVSCNVNEALKSRFRLVFARVFFLSFFWPIFPSC